MSQVQVHREGQALHIVLSGSWMIADAAGLHQALRASCAHPVAGLNVAVLDLAGVHAADTAGVQLLLALARSLRQAGLALQVLQRSPSVDNVARALGASDARQCCGFEGAARALPQAEVAA
jgi:anti-anti-sigma regulatory factor